MPGAGAAGQRSETVQTLLRANPSKGGDAEPRGYSDFVAMLAEPPAIDLRGRVLAAFFVQRVPRETGPQVQAPGERMSELERARDPVAEELERLSFVILQHVYTVADEGMDGERSLIVERIASELAISAQRVVQLVAHLTYAGFVEWAGTRRPVAITQKGVDYIERLAYRRRSLRVFTMDARPE